MMSKKQTRKEIVTKYMRDNPVEGYDEIARQVNISYAETQDIHQTMRDLRLPFDLVWECLGFKDQVDLMEE